MHTRYKILKHTASAYARLGYEGLNMRLVAKDAGIAASVIYHYFSNKDDLLEAMFFQTSKELGKKRASLPPTTSAAQMLSQRVEFQLDHAEAVVAILKYYLHFRDHFAKTDQGFVPETAYLHIKEVLEFGMAQGEFIAMDIDAESKVITHAINGFLLEYYPYTPQEVEKKALIDSITTFILRSIRNK
jgi:AcrR family transcriptional regulator